MVTGLDREEIARQIPQAILNHGGEAVYGAVDWQAVADVIVALAADAEQASDEPQHYITVEEALGERISFYDVKRGDVLIIASLAISDAPAAEEGAIGVLKVRDDSTTRLWRRANIKLPEDYS
jgi:hypothetical protein